MSGVEGCAIAVLTFASMLPLFLSQLTHCNPYTVAHFASLQTAYTAKYQFHVTSLAMFCSPPSNMGKKLD
jgi:hypothetical protein